MTIAPTRHLVLTVDLGGWGIDADVAAHVVAGLSHLDAAPAPAAEGTMAFHCSLLATSELEAISYVTTLAVTALIANGVDHPRLLAVEVSPVDPALV
jgi:hypothetical protein